MPMNRVIHQDHVFPYRDFPLRAMRMSPQADMGFHSHDFTEIVLVTGGRGRHFAESERNITVGAGFIVPEGMGHGYRDTEELELWNLMFSRDTLPLPLLDLAMTPGYQILFGGRPRRHVTEFQVDQATVAAIVPLLTALAAEQQEQRRGYQFASVAWFMRIMLLLIRNLAPDQTSAKAETPVRVGDLIRRLNRHPERMMSLAEMAASVHMSVSGLLRHFRLATGYTPNDYRLRLRLALAGEIMRREPSLPLAEVAFRAGFTDANYFARQFRRVNGLSPSAFHQKLPACRQPAMAGRS